MSRSRNYLGLMIKNVEKFRFSDFTLDHYQEILLTLKRTHTFRSYTDFNRDELFVLNRHDVDFSVKGALKLAEIEHELKVNSTFFFMLHCEYYNLLESQNIDLVKNIAGLGHKIGLHFDAQFYNINDEANLQEKLEFEREILEFFIKEKIEVFSFHNTTDFTMNCKSWNYGGLINTYADYFQSNVKYSSDSNGYWRFDRMMDVIKSNCDKSLQLLTHPVWWTKEIQSPKEKIWNIIESRAKVNKVKYEEILSSFGRENIDW